jgi:hypothetical protein
MYNGFTQWWRGVWEKDDELRKEGGGVGKNGGLLMRGKGCWRLGGSVTEISKNRETAGGWLRLEDEGMKKRWKGRGAGVLWSAEGKKENEKKKKLDSGRRGLLVLWSSLSPSVFPSSPLSFSLFYRQGKPCGDNGIRDKP